MQTIGQSFDPNLHEAVGEEESEQPDQTIVREVQAGFTLHSKVIRHAKVISKVEQIENSKYELIYWFLFASFYHHNN